MKITITSNGTGLASIKLEYKNKTYVEHWEETGQEDLMCKDSIEDQLKNEDIDELQQITNMLDNLDIREIMENSYGEEE